MPEESVWRERVLGSYAEGLEDGRAEVLGNLRKTVDFVSKAVESSRAVYETYLSPDSYEIWQTQQSILLWSEITLQGLAKKSGMVWCADGFYEAEEDA